MSTTVLACAPSKSPRKERIIINESFSWDRIVETFSSKFSLASCSSVLLMDSDGDSMSPPITTSVKFHKFSKMHSTTPGSFFEIEGVLSSIVTTPNSMAIRDKSSTLSTSRYSRSPTLHPSSAGSSTTISRKKTVSASASTSTSTTEETTSGSDEDDISHIPSRPSSAGSYTAGRRTYRSLSSLPSPISPLSQKSPASSRSHQPQTSTRESVSRIRLEADESSPTVHNAAKSPESLTALQHLIMGDKGLLKSKDAEGNSPLHVACNSSNVAAIEWLILQGADLLARNLNGSIPLHFLCATGEVSVLRRIKAERRVSSFDFRNDSDLHLLHIAAHKGQTDTVLWLCEHGGVTNIDMVNDNGLTSLHLACWGNHLRVAKVLVSKGAHVNIRDSNALTPLFFACSFGDMSLVQWLVDQGALIQISGLVGDTPLHFACRNGREDIARYLVSAGADPSAPNNKGETPVDKALLSDNVGLADVMRQLVAANAIPEASLASITSLHRACALGNVDRVKALLDEGMEVDALNESHNTGLYYAVRTSNLAMCEFLASQGAKIDVRDRYTGMTPLHTACLKGSMDMAMWLIDAGADAKCLSSEKRSTLHYACFSGCMELIEELIDIGVSVNGANTDGYTPLHDCCAAGNVEAAQYVVERGANIYCKNGYGLNGLHLACKYGHVRTVEWLLESFRDKYDVPDYHGMSPFLTACAGGHFQIARRLATKGANINMESYGVEQRNSALHFACSSGSIPLVEWLLKDMHMNANKVNSKQKTPFILCGDNMRTSADLFSWMRTNASRYSIELSAPSESSDASGGLLDGASPLHGAAGLGDVNMMDRLIKNGSDVNARTVLGQTPLHFACMQGELDAVKNLVGNGADPSLRDRQGNSPSDLASSNGHNEIVDWLRANSRKPKKQGVLSPSMFSCFPVSGPQSSEDRAVAGGRLAGLAQQRSAAHSSPAMSAGSKAAPPMSAHSSRHSAPDESSVEEGTRLCDACAGGNLSLVRSLVDKGANIDAVCSPGSRTPLHCAVLSENMDVIQYLLSKKPRVNVQNVGGMTPLHIACDRKNCDIALLLIHKGADINTLNNAGHAALHIIASHGLNSLLQNILTLPRTVLQEVDLMLKSSDGRTLMHTAAEQNNLGLIDMLSGYPQLVNSRDETHRTPLHYACMLSHGDAAERLVENDAFVNARDDGGMTPLILACNNGNIKLAKYLVSKGATVQAESDEGNSLHFACRAGDMSMAKWLVKSGVNPNDKGHQTMSPIQCVDKREHPQLIDWLLAWSLAQDTGRSIDDILMEMHSD
jgi:ankyrin repeat protein